MALFKLSDTTHAYLIAVLPRMGKVHLQVYGPANVRIADRRETLEMSAGGIDQGLTIASADGIVSLHWKGPLWAIPTSSGASIDIEVML